jgi:NAD(P)-dependent dehydrogenase (short-subunit alcohol dehydrogenase family)
MGASAVGSAVVIGAGPGLGQAVAGRFARAGLPVAVLARRASTTGAVVEALAPTGVPVLGLVADVTDETSLRAALDRAATDLAPPEVIVYNAALIRPDRPGELPTRDHQHAWAVNVVGALTAAAHTAPQLTARGGGSFLITGGMPEPDPDYVSLSLGKAGLRALATLLHREYGPAGLHIATITVAGPIAAHTAFDPDIIAEHYWRLHTQPPDHWQHEIIHRG